MADKILLFPEGIWRGQTNFETQMAVCQNEHIGATISKTAHLSRQIQLTPLFSSSLRLDPITNIGLSQVMRSYE